MPYLPMSLGSSWHLAHVFATLLGYVEADLQADSLWGPRGAVLRGHEFHYSELTDNPADRDGWNTAYTLKKYRSEDRQPEGFQRGRVLASYVHLHLASRPEAVDYFVNHCGVQA